jgi:UDP-glucose 4-epimerase
MRVMGARLQPEYGPERKVNAVPRRLASIEKTKRMLGWAPQVDLEDGLARLVSWWRINKEHVA